MRTEEGSYREVTCRRDRTPPAIGAGAVSRRRHRRRRRRRRCAHYATMMIYCILSSAIAASTTLIRAPISAVLRGDSHLQLALQLIERGDVVDRILESEFSEFAPVLVPLCWSTAEWTVSELSELQWPPLVDKQRTRSAELRALAEEHASADTEIFSGRYTGAAALLTALELTHCHALECDGELWLLPETAGFERSAPYGATLSRCADSGDLLLVADAAAEQAAAEQVAAAIAQSGVSPPPERPPQLLDLIFTGLPQLGDEPPEAGEDGDGWTVCSGAKSNDELLLSEGWADEDLSCDAFTLPEAELREAASRILGEIDGASESVMREREAILDGLRSVGMLPADGDGLGEVRSGGAASDTLVRAARALCLTRADLQAHGGVGGCVELLREVIDDRDDPTQARAAKVLASACEVLLGRCQTSIEEDEAMLQQVGVELASLTYACNLLRAISRLPADNLPPACTPRPRMRSARTSQTRGALRAYARGSAASAASRRYGARARHADDLVLRLLKICGMAIDALLVFEFGDKIVSSRPA